MLKPSIRSSPWIRGAPVCGEARAHRWFDELSTGKAKSLAQIATREGLGVRYVGRLVRLAFLAPEIVEFLMRGGQPMTMPPIAAPAAAPLPALPVIAPPTAPSAAPRPAPLTTCPCGGSGWFDGGGLGALA